MKRFVSLSLVALLMIAGLVAAAPKRGGTLVYGRYADSLFLDPVLNDANVDIWILTNLYDTLLQPTDNGKGVKPWLATKYNVSKDGKTFTLTLRQGVKFADGSALTPGDVKWSLDRARNPDNGAWNALVASISAVAVQGNQIVLSLKYPDPSLPAALATFNTGIMPQKLFNSMPGATDEAKAKVFAEKPIGSGPFVLSEWKKGSRMTLKRNPYYWGKSEDGQALPYLDELRFEIVPDDNTRILKLQSGELDGAEFIPLSRVAELKADPKLNMQLFPSTEVDFVIMNSRPKLKNGSDNPLSNVKVRQALNYATDKDALVKLVTYGNGKPMKSFMSSATPLVDNSLTGYAFDLERAKKLMKDAGYPNGFETSTLAVSGNADQAGIAAALQQMWAQIGVKLKIDLLDSPTARARYRANDFQMRISAWTDDIADPSEITSYFAIFKNVESLHTGFQSDQLEALFEQSQREPSQVKRAVLYQQIQRIYYNAAPIIFMFEKPYPVALQKSVKGFVQIPLGNNIFVNASNEK